MKKGSFDNYLLNTREKHIDSRMGLLLRSLIKQKQKDPEFEIPYIAGQANRPRTKKTNKWEMRDVSTIHMPAAVKVTTDFT